MASSLRLNAQSLSIYRWQGSYLYQVVNAGQEVVLKAAAGAVCGAGKGGRCSLVLHQLAPQLADLKLHATWEINSIFWEWCYRATVWPLQHLASSTPGSSMTTLTPGL
eukprot:1153090-Pelagomonas_calceolata.AAC.5